MKISNESRVGLLAIAALALLFFGYNLLIGNDLFNSNNHYFAKYPTVSGVSPASTVIYSGLTVGKVKEIDLANDGKIFVKFEIRKDIQIPLNSTAKIVSADLLGSKSIEIILSKNSEMHLNGDTILGSVEVSLQEKVNETILPVKVKAEQLISSLDTMVQVIEMMFDDQARQNIGQSLNDFTSTLASMKNTASTVENIVNNQSGSLLQILENVESISRNFKENNDQITKLLVNMGSISDSVQSADIMRTINGAKKALEDFAVISDKINNGEGTAGLLLNDKRLYDNLANSAANLDSLMKDLKENPSRYVSISVFGGGKDKKNKKKKPGQTRPKGENQ